MGELVEIELNKKLFKNIDESALTSTYAALENCYVTESNGLSRFPGLVEFADLGSGGEIHMSRYQNDMVAVGTDGRSFRVDSNGTPTEIEGPLVLGGNRTSFAKTRDGLGMAAGDQIILFDGKKNTVLSDDAPLAGWIGYIDGYMMAVERGSGRFQHSELNDIRDWPALNTFGVDGSPDDINAMIITPYNEILFSGEESIEQYERYIGGDVPFFRRWSVGDGIIEPYTLCYADNSVWGLNDRMEFVRITGQTTQSASDDIGKEIEDRYGMSNLSGINKAWASQIFIKGQKFVLFQSPEATNVYGTKGFTAVIDIRRGQWFELFGWNDRDGVPDLWPGRSVFRLWGKTFVGGTGKIYELSSDAYSNDGSVQRAYVRTAHFDTLGTMRVNKVRMTVRRGVGSYTVSPKIAFRSNPDHKGFGNYQYRELGNVGDRDMIIEFGAQGLADTWQFEWFVTDDCSLEIRRLQLEVDKIAR